MFVEVEPEDLVVGVKYALLYWHDPVRYSTGTFEYRNGDSSVHKFHYLKKHYYIENAYFYNEFLRIEYNSQRTGKPFYYYAFVSKKDKIQQRMEKRALDKILKRVTNDDLFVW
jgi:hypothetical protein